MESTPRPWRAEYRDWRHQPSLKAYISGGAYVDEDGLALSTGVCIVEGNETSREVTEANTQLILTAVNNYDSLLAACEEMVRTLTCPSRLLSDITRSELAPWLPMLRAAIDKANGS